MEGISNNHLGQSSLDIDHLLKDWKLENILPHLRAEKIDAEILEMMKLHHVRTLLHNFPLGIQIRFEHNLEQWRYNIGKPMPRCSQETQYCVCLQGGTNNAPRTESPRQNSLLTSSDSQIQQKQKQNVQIIKADNKTIYTVTAKDSTENNTFLHVNNNNTPPDSSFTNSSAESTPCTLMKTSNFVHAESSAAAAPVERLCEIAVRPYSHLPKVNLREILLDSKPDGPHLLKIYNLRKCFSRPERRRLINAIVTYFMRNELKFDLQTSYVVEKAILAMFPSERLDMYRKNKRGSIYCKYMNAKTYISCGQGRRRRNVRPSGDNEDTIDDSDTEKLPSNEDNDEEGVGNDRNSANTSSQHPSDLELMDEEFSYCFEDDDSKHNLIKPKVEMDSDIKIQTAYRLHREAVTLRCPYSYNTFLQEVCNVYSIPNMDDHYLAVNDCEIKEVEFENVIIQYYQLPTFIVEVKEKSFLSNELDFDEIADLESIEETKIEIAADHLPSASEIRTIPLLLPIVALTDLGKSLENKHRATICNAVIDECLSLQPNRVLKRQDFMSLAQNICQAFANEVETTYFIPSHPKCPASGKLWCTYNRKRSILLHSGMAEKRFLKNHKIDNSQDLKEEQNFRGDQMKIIHL
ncbi:uncharacterized protein LOC142237996 [Haematobia irritans]|uniref:uncharacterized protein LOC142237996 n=1 Tax=Haematobia irritans TaxID=7368 RepID=UPI003F50937E